MSDTQSSIPSQQSEGLLKKLKSWMNGTRQVSKPRQLVLEPLEDRSLLAALVVGSEDGFTTISMEGEYDGKPMDLTIFSGADYTHIGYDSNHFYAFDANGSFGTIKNADLGANRRIKVYGTPGNDKITNDTGKNLHNVAAEMTAYGMNGDDILRGSTGYDKLIGGEGKDQLFGMAGDDVLYGGKASDNDELTGGTGEDRFYIRSEDRNLELGVDTVMDKHKLDSRVHLVDTTENKKRDEHRTFKPATWSDADFELVDEVFQHLHNTTGSERLMQSHSGGDIYEYRLGLTTNNEPDNGAWTNGFNSDWYPSGTNEFNDSLLNKKGTAVVHEILHHFDMPQENQFIDDFRKISGWTDVQPASFITFDAWLKLQEDPNYPGYHGFVQNASKTNEWFNPKGLSWNDLFYKQYGGHTSREDFSVTSQHWHAKYILGEFDAKGNQEKLDNLQLLFNEFSRPTKPTDLTIDQSVNMARPSFSWESLAADYFHIQIKNAKGEMFWDLITSELKDMQVPYALPVGHYTFTVTSYNYSQNNGFSIESSMESPTESIDFIVNHAPTWSADVSRPTLKNINEDSTNNQGTSVESLTSGVVDLDVGSKKGIAVVSTPGDNGRWQYSVNGGTNWTDFTATESNALLLAANGNSSLVRFVPNSHFHGSVQLSYFAWDQTEGLPRQTMNIEGKHGGMTAFSLGKHHAPLTVKPVNDSPSWSAEVERPKLHQIKEDSINNPGTSVAALTRGVTDVDSGSKKGIAVFSSHTGNGKWQYSTDKRETWNDFPEVSNNNALLLAADGINSRVRFVPNKDFHGSVQLGYVPWDQTQGTAGNTLDLLHTSSRGRMSAVSGGRHFASLTIESVNDAPTWAADVERPKLNDIKNNHVENRGTSVVALTRGVNDADFGSKKGIAVVSTPSDMGRWEYSLNDGGNWTSFTATETAALLLSADGRNSRVRFVPNKDFSGGVQLGYVPWDQTQGEVGKSFNIENTRGGSSAFSGGTHYAKLSVSAVNKSPYWLDGAIRPKLDDIDEDSFDNWGTSVKSLTAGVVDSDVGAKKGIAVVFTASDKGRWQYTLNGGGKWTDFSATESNALLLAANDKHSRVRFVPNPNFRGQVEFGYRPWDQTQGEAGKRFNIEKIRGGWTAFSEHRHHAPLTVNPVNDAPKFNSNRVSLNQVVNGMDNPGTPISKLVNSNVTDVDFYSKKGIAVFQDTLPSGTGKWQYTLNNGRTWTDFQTMDRSNALLLPADGGRSRVRLVPNTGVAGTWGISYYAWDQTQGTAGGTMDISGEGKLGGTTAFSEGSHFSSIKVVM